MERFIAALARLAENRRPVPASRFAEYAPERNPETKKDVVWFTLDDGRPLFTLAGIDRHEVEADPPDLIWSTAS